MFDILWSEIKTFLFRDFTLESHWTRMLKRIGQTSSWFVICATEHSKISSTCRSIDDLTFCPLKAAFFYVIFAINSFEWSLRWRITCWFTVASLNILVTFVSDRSRRKLISKRISVSSVVLIYNYQIIDTFYYLVTHTGERKFRCMFCDRSFADSGNLRKHKLRDHAEETADYESKHGKKGISNALFLQA